MYNVCSLRLLVGDGNITRGFRCPNGPGSTRSVLILKRHVLYNSDYDCDFNDDYDCWNNDEYSYDYNSGNDCWNNDDDNVDAVNNHHNHHKHDNRHKDNNRHKHN